MALTKDFGFGPDEQLVRDQARKFLRDNFGIERLRKLVAADHQDRKSTRLNSSHRL